MGNLAEVMEEVLCSKDVAITSLDLIKIQVIKKKYLGQVRQFNVNLAENNLPSDQLGVIGWYETESFEYVLFTYGNPHRNVQLGRLDMYGYALRTLIVKDPDIFLWNKDETNEERSFRYQHERDEVEKTVRMLKNTLPQLFVS